MNNKNLPVNRQKLSMALEAINAKLSEIKEIQQTPFKTNCQFSQEGRENYLVDITKVRGSQKLIEIYAFIKGKEITYNESLKELNIKEAPIPKHGKYSTDDWKHDLKLRMAIVMQHEEIERLNKAKQKLESFLTEEDQLAITLQQLGFADNPK